MPYEISWNGPGINDGSFITSSSNAHITGLPAGDYTISIEDANGCTSLNQSVSVGELAALDVEIVGDENFCFDQSTGTLTTMPSSGLSHSWSTGASSSSIAIPNPGSSDDTYTVVVTDAVGCTGNDAITVTRLNSITMNLTGIAPSTSGGNDGKIDVILSAGIANYAWERSGSGTTSGTSSSNTFEIPGVSPGSYSVTVTDDNGCSVNGGVTVPDADPSCSITISGATSTSPDCRNGGNGSVVLSTSNYSSTYSISWSGEETGNLDGNSVDNVTIQNLSSGSYAFTVTDDLGCTTTIPGATVSNPPQITFSTSEGNGACSGLSNGIIQVNNISNGSPPYVISWDGPGNNDGQLAASSSSNQQISGLPGGSYSVIVEDNNGCAPLLQNITISESSAVSVTITGVDVFCFEDGNQALSVSPSGFSQYEWSTGANSPAISIPNPGVTTETYSVTVTDGSGCTGSDAITVSSLTEISINLNIDLSTIVTSTEFDCDGAIDISVTGGLSPYNYLWSGPDSYTNINEDIDDLCTGNYTLTITDSEGCTTFFNQFISVPTSLNILANSTDASCNGESDGTVTVDVSNGTPPYSYLWMPGNHTSQSVSGLLPGTYTVSVTDVDNNTGIAAATVGEPNTVLGIISPSNAEICLGDSVRLTASGGSSFTWSDNLGSNSELVVSPLSTYTYDVTVTNAGTNNCIDTVSVTVTVNELPNAIIDVSETSGLESNDTEICEGDQVVITAAGGLSYSWEGGQSNPFTVSPESGTESYRVTVTDSNGCSDTETVDVTINENPTAVVDFSNASQVVQDIQLIKSNSIANCGSILECTWEVDGSVDTSGDCEGIMPVFISTGTKNISLSVVNSCGCSDETSNVLEIIGSDQCAIINFTVNNGVGIACDGTYMDFEVEERASPGCLINTRNLEVLKDGVLVAPGTEFEFLVNSIRFNSTGTYEMIYSIVDDCGCSTSSTRQIDIVPSPEISFLAGNPTSGCEGETVNIKLSGFDQGEKVTIEFSEGNMVTYVEDNFDFILGGNVTETMTITKVENLSCEVEVVNQSIEVNIIPKFEVLSQSTECATDGLSYNVMIVTEGGQVNESIIGDGILGTGSGSNNYVIPDLDPNQEYSFTLRRGDVCDEVEVNLSTLICDCSSSGIEHADLASLLDFYNATDGASWNNNSGWIDAAMGIDCDPCSGWFGIQCDDNGNVVSIDLDGEADFTNLPSLLGNNLQGNLVDIDIPTLTYLNLAGNQLDGNLIDFTKIASIKMLLLNNNDFQGTIPTFSNSPSIELLDLSNNSLEGSIPNLQSLTMLQDVDFSNNQLTGCFTEGFCNIEYDFTGNFALPWNGDYERYCSGEDQEVAFCGVDQQNTIVKTGSDCTCEENCKGLPTINSDRNLVYKDQNFSIPVTENDTVGAIVMYEIVNHDNVLFESLSLTENGVLEGAVSTYFADTIEIVVEICVESCEDCISGSVYLINDELNGIVPTNVISPNGDGTNDFLRFTLESKMEGSKLTVFNQWGNQVYSKNDYDNSWDASGIPGGIYFYILEYNGLEIKSALTILK